MSPENAPPEDANTPETWEPDAPAPGRPDERQAGAQPRGKDEVRRELGPGDGDDPPPDDGDDALRDS